VFPDDSLDMKMFLCAEHARVAAINLERMSVRILFLFSIRIGDIFNNNAYHRYRWTLWSHVWLQVQQELACTVMIRTKFILLGNA